jgi:hypothetical protein
MPSITMTKFKRVEVVLRKLVGDPLSPSEKVIRESKVKAKSNVDYRREPIFFTNPLGQRERK